MRIKHCVKDDLRDRLVFNKAFLPYMPIVTLMLYAIFKFSSACGG